MSLSLAELIRLLPPPPTAAPALPTGIATLDNVLLGGGLPRGRLTEIVGNTGSGKTTLTRALVEETIAAHGWVAYIDAQRTLDPRDWIHLGDKEGVWMIRPHDANRAAWSADILLRSGAFALIVLDTAPLLTRATAVRLTRLARESNAALVVLGDRAGAATQLGGAVRLVVERTAPRRSRPERTERHERHERSDPLERSAPPGAAAPPAPRSPRGTSERENAIRTIAVRVEKGGTLKTVEVTCAIPVARRLCAHSEVPDRRGVARGPVGGTRHGKGGRRAAAPPVHAPERNAPIVIDASPEQRARYTRALG